MVEILPTSQQIRTCRHIRSMRSIARLGEVRAGDRARETLAIAQAERVLLLRRARWLSVWTGRGP